MMIALDVQFSLVKRFFWFWGLKYLLFFIDACDDDHPCLFFDGGLRL